jgi:hypothetical protein
MGAIAGARRTQSSFSAYLTSTDSSDLDVGVYPHSETPLSVNSPYYRHLATEIAHLPDVKRVASYPEIFATPITTDGAPNTPQALNDNQVATFGSVNGEYFDQDRVVATEGRLANPARANQFVATAQAAELLRWHIGQVVPFGVFTYQQSNLPGFGTSKVQPYFRISATLTGIVVFQSEIVSDDVDRFPTYVLFTPAFTRRVASASYDDTFGLRLDDPGDVTAVEREIVRILPRGSIYNFHLTSVVQGEVQRAVKPEAIALGAFGAIAGIAALVIAGQAIGRLLQSNREELDIVRALGAGPLTTTAEDLLGALSAVLLGSLVAVGVAVGLSPLSPIGPVAQVFPSASFAFDWTVLGLGLVVLIVGVGGLTMTLAFLGSPYRRAAPEDRATSRASVAGCRGGRESGVAGVGRHGYPLCPRARTWPQYRPGAIGAARCRPRGHGGRGHPDIRQRSQHPGVQPAPVRMELELRD